MESPKYCIHKFGGACLANPHKIDLAVNAIYKEISQSDTKNVIVVSATLGVTDSIRNAIKQLFINENSIQKTLEEIDSFHGQFIKVFPDLQPVHESLCSTLESSLQNAVNKHSLSAEERDKCLVTGEKFMIHVLVNFLQQSNLQAVSLTPEELDLKTDGKFFKAVIDFSSDFSTLKSKIDSTVDKNKIVVIPGFYGIYDSKITTFGPSGTDYTATAIGNILNAEKIIIWKDINGFMTSDPRLVDAKTIDTLGYNEAAELAHFGAKILHPRAVLPAQIKQIPIEIRNINNNVKSLIIPDHKTKSKLVKSISFMKDIGLLKVYITSGGTQNSVLHAIFSTFAEHNINIFAIATSSTAITFLLNQIDLEIISPLLPIEHPFIEKLEIIIDICLICLVGKDLGITPDMASEIFHVIGKAGINIEMITAGASPVAIQFTVKQTKLEECLSHLHNHFFSQKVEKIVELV